MKKTIIILLAVMLIISSASLAEDLSSLSDEEFLELYKHVTEEMASRFSSSRQEYPEMIGPAGNMDEAAGERVTAFFCDWYQNRFDDMLALCASGWKAKAENPGLELAGILANRTALRIIENCEIEKIGIISYFEDDFPDILKNCTNEEGKKDPPVCLICPSFYRE